MIKLKEAHKDGLMKRLSNIVLFDPVDTFLQELAAKNGIRLVSYDDVLKAGDVGNTQLNRCKTEDIFCLCYTSGTTGVPKGVKLSH